MNRPIKKAFSLYVVLFLIMAQTLTASVSAADMGQWKRIYGSNRYKTAVEISKKGWASSQYAVLARGDDFADALCAGPLANKYGAPLLLTGTDEYDINITIKDEN